MTDAADLIGYSVLVVEDDYCLATDAARALQGASAEVLGPCPTEETAGALLQARPPDAVLLDINLGRGASFKLAETLRDRGIPFVFTPVTIRTRSRRSSSTSNAWRSRCISVASSTRYRSSWRRPPS